MTHAQLDVFEVLAGLLRDDLTDEDLVRLDHLERYLRSGVQSLDAHPFGGTAIAARSRMAHAAAKLGFYEVDGWEDVE